MPSVLQEAYIGLGSNLGEPKEQLDEAVRLLRTHASIFDLALSRYYRTKPMYIVEQPDYVNAVCRFKTDLSPEELLRELQKIEQTLGKKAKPKNWPRRIDLDILFFGKVERHTEELDIPHPRWRERLFVLQPLADLTDFLSLPGHSQPVDLRALLRSNYPDQVVVPLC